MSRRDDKLDELLHGLPRFQASPGFTERLMRRYHEPRRREIDHRFVLAVASVAVVVAVCVTSLFWYKHHLDERARMTAELGAIKSEYARLVQQSDGYHGAVADFAVLHLGSGRETELVLDVARLEEIDDIPLLKEGEEQHRFSGAIQLGEEIDQQLLLPVGGDII